MNENRYVVGVDIGTSTVRIVVASVAPDKNLGDPESLTIVGVGESPVQGMRKGTVVDIKRVASAVDKAAGLAEEMCGFEIKEGLISINGTHISGRKSHGLITVDKTTPIDAGDVNRVINAATQVKMPPNSQVIEAQPYLYKIDDQDGIREPVGMDGLRLEVDVYLMTALIPYIKNLDQVAEQGEIRPIDQYMPAGLAAANIALTDRQKESGSLLIDFGHSTTTMVVYEEGNVIDIKVLPVGSSNITNDLAIGLKTDLDIAEMVKLKHAVASPSLRRSSESVVSIKLGNAQIQKKLDFESELVDDIVEARLDELFELINNELKKIKRKANLPGGAVITGGGANLSGLASYAKSALGMNVKIYRSQGFRGVTERVRGSEWTTALGLAACSAIIGAGVLVDDGSSAGGPLAGIFDKITSLFQRRHD